MKLCLGIAVLLALFFLEEAAEWAYKRTARYRRSLGSVGKFVDGVPKGLEIVNIGSGPGVYAISYEKCPLRGFNMSTAPQNFQYGYKILQNYCNNVIKNAIIIIIMCPLSFGNNTDYEKRDYSDQYYYFLPPEMICDYSPLRAWWLRHPLLGAALRRARNWAAEVAGRISGAGPARVDSEAEPELIRVWKREFELHDLRDASQAGAHEDAFRRKIELLTEEINYCRDQGWRPLLLVPAVPPGTRAYISREFKRAFVDDNIEKICARVDGIPVLDYFDDERFGQEMYNGDIFMNEEGRERFSAVLFDEIAMLYGGIKQ